MVSEIEDGLPMPDPRMRLVLERNPKNMKPRIFMKVVSYTQSKHGLCLTFERVPVNSLEIGDQFYVIESDKGMTANGALFKMISPLGSHNYGDSNNIVEVTAIKSSIELGAVLELFMTEDKFNEPTEVADPVKEKDELKFTSTILSASMMTSRQIEEMRNDDKSGDQEEELVELEELFQKAFAVLDAPSYGFTSDYKFTVGYSTTEMVNSPSGPFKCITQLPPSENRDYGWYIYFREHMECKTIGYGERLEIRPSIFSADAMKNELRHIIRYFGNSKGQENVNPASSG